MQPLLKRVREQDNVQLYKTLQLDIGNAYREITEIKFEEGRPFEKVTHLAIAVVDVNHDGVTRSNKFAEFISLAYQNSGNQKLPNTTFPCRYDRPVVFQIISLAAELSCVELPCLHNIGTHIKLATELSLLLSFPYLLVQKALR